MSTVLQNIFKDHYEKMIYILHPRKAVIKNVDRMIHCGDPSFGSAMYGCSSCHEGISVEQVQEDILEAIAYALKSEDPQIQEFWKDIPHGGEGITVEETVNYIITNLPKEES